MPDSSQTLCDYRPGTAELQSRVILVTGAARGLGAATALACARAGATLVLLDRDVAAMEAVYDRIVEAGAPEPALYPMDLAGAQVGDYDDLAHTLEENFGRLDGLIHNAAELGALSPMHHSEPQLWFRVIQVNLHAPYLLTRACLGLLQAAPQAAMVFVSDRQGRQGHAFWGAYGVSKFGLEGLMQIVADETEGHTQIRVNSFDPGALRTPLRRLAYPGELPEEAPPPEECAPAMVYLMGPAGRRHHGQSLSSQTCLNDSAPRADAS